MILKMLVKFRFWVEPLVCLCVLLTRIRGTSYNNSHKLKWQTVSQNRLKKQWKIVEAMLCIMFSAEWIFYVPICN